MFPSIIEMGSMNNANKPITLSVMDSNKRKLENFLPKLKKKSFLYKLIQSINPFCHLTR